MTNEINFLKLSNLFSTNFIDLIVQNAHWNKLYKLLDESNGQFLLEQSSSLGDLYEKIYHLLLKNYKCEYIYKNTIANKLLLKKHNPQKSVLLHEFAVDRSKADIVIINGTSTVYEIKTELDSLNRLDSQLASYKKVFDQIYVVSYEEQAEKLKDILEDHVGIITLTPRLAIKIIKEAKSNLKNIEPLFILNSLRKKEYSNIIRKEFGFIPNVPNGLFYRECKKLFLKIDKETVHSRMLEELKNRGQKQHILKLIETMPYSLKLLSFDYDISRNSAIKLETNLLTSFSF